MTPLMNAALIVVPTGFLMGLAWYSTRETSPHNPFKDTGGKDPFDQSGMDDIYPPEAMKPEEKY